MAVVTISTAQVLTPQKWPVLPVVAGSLTMQFVAAAVTTDGLDFSATGREIVLFQNSGASPYTFTVVSAPDALGRTGDITAYSLAAGEIAALTPPPLGWAGGNGRILITVSNLAVKVGIIRAGVVL
jgi:hypothetical protein